MEEAEGLVSRGLEASKQISEQQKSPWDGNVGWR